jgi:hypothetical protein
MSSTGADPAQEPGAAREERALEAAGAAAESGRLLPGEDPARADAEDAARWVDVYSDAAVRLVHRLAYGPHPQRQLRARADRRGV